MTKEMEKKKFEFDEEQEQIDFVQPHKKIEVNLVKFDTPYTDAISRQSAIDSMREETCLSCWDAKDILKNLPSVSTEKTGHWIMTSDYLTAAYGSIDYVKCSCCQEYSLEEGNYCPNCGAKMIEPKEV